MATAHGMKIAFPRPTCTNTREGTVRSRPQRDFDIPRSRVPDTLPADFLFAECGGYGANIWYSYYWDQSGWYDDQYIPKMSKWESFVQ